MRELITRRTFLIAAAATSVFLPRDARAAPLVIGSEDYPPYAFNFRGGRRGYDVEKVTMVLEELKYRPLQRSMIRAALFKGLEEDVVDVAFPFTETPLRLQKYIVAGALHNNRSVLAMRKDEAKEPMTLESIAGLRVAVTERHRYPAAFESLTNITRVPCSSLNLAVRRLSYGRVDAVIGDRTAMDSMVQVEGLEHKIHVSPQSLGSGTAYCLFPKSHVALATAFNDTLKRLAAAGRFKDLEARFPSVDPPK